MRAYGRPIESSGGTSSEVRGFLTVKPAYRREPASTGLALRYFAGTPDSEQFQSEYLLTGVQPGKAVILWTKKGHREQGCLASGCQEWRPTFLHYRTKTPSQGWLALGKKVYTLNT